MSEDFNRACHIRIDKVTKMHLIRGSKYLQSIIGDSFEDVKVHLEQGIDVLFSGTPCQICGLKAFWGKEYDNLNCVDVICHGVPSYVLWNKYLDYIRKKIKDPISSISFRSKRESWRAFGQEYDTGKKGTLFYSKEEDIFLRLFLSDCALIPSCYECFVKENNYYLSDITLGDFWSINRIDETFNDGNGVSLIIYRKKR